MHESLAWTRGAWQPLTETKLALDDVGVLQGVVMVDRLRTVHGGPSDSPAHVARLRSNCQAIGIAWPAALELEELQSQCATLNRKFFGDKDFSIVSIITPGQIGSATPTPTVIVHAAGIDWSKLDSWYTYGQHLIIPATRNVPNACWSPALKTRARLQYYLADQSAANSQHAHAGAVLLDLHGNLTETAQANVLIVENGSCLISPPEASILPGISLQRTLRLAREIGLHVSFEPISVARAGEAEEIVLCGSTGCLWSAHSLDDKILPTANRVDGIARRLAQAWMADIGLDFVAQARQLS